MLGKISHVSLGAAALTALSALSGCTIYTYQNPPPRTRAAQTATRPATPRPATPAPTQTSGPKIIVRGVPAVTVQTPTPGGDRAPRITSAILFGNGTGGVFKGEAYVIPQTAKVLPDLDALVPFATLFTDHFDIPSQEFSGGFPGALRQDEWFAIRYEGPFVLQTAGTIEFELTSDDGTLLSIDGRKILDDDGLHAAATKTTAVDLAAGPHRLRLDYFQGNKGPVALQLFATDRGGRIFENPLVRK